MNWLQLIRRLYSRINGFVIEVTTIATSKQRLKQLFHVSFYANALYLLIANIVIAVVGFVFWIIAARFYSPEDVGLASAAISATLLLGMLATLGLGFGLIRFLSSSGRDANSMINSCFTLGGLASVVVAFIFLSGLSLWSPSLLFIRQDPIYLAGFVISTIAYTLWILTDQAFVAERRAGFVLAKSLIASLLKLPLPILLAAFFHSFGIFASWGVSLCVALLLCIFLFLPRVQRGYRPFLTVNKEAVNDILHFSFANYLGGLFWSAPALILPLMVVNLLGAKANACFYIAWAIGAMLMMIPSAASTSLFAEGSYEEEGLGVNLWRSLKLVSFILVPAVTLTLAFADKLLLFFGTLYSETATTLLRILAISTFPLAINALYIGVKIVEKKLRLIVCLTASVAAVTIGLAYLLLPRMGINGAGIAWLAIQGAIALVIMVSFLKKWRVVGKQHIQD